MRIVLLFLLATLSPLLLLAENGYELWLRYRPLPEHQADFFEALTSGIRMPTNTATQKIIDAEWNRARLGFLANYDLKHRVSPHSLTYVNIANRNEAPGQQTNLTALTDASPDAYQILSITSKGKTNIYIVGKTDIAWLYATYHLLRLFQTGDAVNNLDLFSSPRVQHRMLNHWDNLDRTVERGYAGASIWNWHHLPGYEDQRYHDYARANASVGINGTVLTNVNANATILTPAYLQKVKKLADIFRPYGIRVYLTARFSAPIEIGRLKTADPLDPAVAAWWSQKTEEIYKLIPDFGGFLVKANSEGQPGPQDYKRTHADGANMLAKAVAEHKGIVIWRAFVYSAETPEDRHKQANLEFMPLDGKFDANVLVQVKNGAIDFQPREPFHPLFGAMPRTQLVPELQITQEYLGQATNMVYLAPLFKECLDADTYQPKGNTVAKLMETQIGNSVTAIAGVANIGSDINWTGHLIGQSNWYAFGRLAWDHRQSSKQIAIDWISLTFSEDKKVSDILLPMLMNSREVCVKYMTPLGLHHLMGTGHHYGPAPWVNDLGRADWTPVYYHRADSNGIGFNRTATGTKALLQYASHWQQAWGDPSTMDERYLLWFHHLPWDFKMKSGKSLWDALCMEYESGYKSVQQMRAQWETLKSRIDSERFNHVKMLLAIQEQEAQWWKEACLLYFQQYSQKPFPAGVSKPQQTLEYFKSLRFPYAPGH